MAINSYNSQMLAHKTSSSVEEYNEVLKKNGRASSSLEIKTKDDLKQQYQSFIRLLMAQLKHQDPSEPMKNEAFVSQLVKFSHLEQAIKSNETQNKVLDEQQITHLINSAHFIDKEVEFSSSQFHKEEGQSQKLTYTLPVGVMAAKLFILSPEGNILNTYEVDKTTGQHVFNWDGKDRNSRELPTGNYSIQIHAYDKQGHPIKSADQKEYKVPVSTYQKAKGSMMDQGKTKVQVGGGLNMPLESILSIQSANVAA